MPTSTRSRGSIDTSVELPSKSPRKTPAKKKAAAPAIAEAAPPSPAKAIKPTSPRIASPAKPASPKIASPAKASSSVPAVAPAAVAAEPKEPVVGVSKPVVKKTAEKKAVSSSSSLSAPNLVIRVFLFCLTSWPVCVFLASLESLYHDHWLLFGVAVPILIALAFLAYPTIFKHLPASRRSDPYLYLFLVMAWTTIVDFQLALTIDGRVKVLDFYLAQGERYLQSAYGSLINWWDGTVHFLLYIHMIYSLSLGSTQSQTGRNTSLYYVGSIMNSLFVFLPGNVTGPYGDQIKASYILNVPFVVVPLYYLARVLKDSRKPRIAPKRTQASSAIDLVNRTLFVIFFVLVTILCTVRALSIFNTRWEGGQIWLAKYEPFFLDITTYPRWQAMVNALYYIPFFVYAIVSLLNHKVSGTLTDLSLLVAGALAQGQFSLFGIVFYNRTEARFKLVEETFQFVTIINVLFFVIPHLFAWYCVRQFRVTPQKVVSKQQ